MGLSAFIRQINMTNAETNDHLKNIAITQFARLTAIACLHSDISPQTIEHWSHLLSLIDQIDDDFDCGNTQQRSLVSKSAVEFVQSGTGHYQDNSLANQVRSAIPTSRRHEFAADLSHQFAVTDTLAQTSDPQEYANATLIDGQTAALFFKYFLPESLQNHPNVPKFEAILKKVGGIFKLLDSLWDLESDCASGQVQVTDLSATKKQLKHLLSLQIAPALLQSR